MSFVIKNDIELKNYGGQNSFNIANEFDIEPYNYVFNNSTAFIDSRFASDHPRILENILQTVEAYNIKYFKQLNFVRIEGGNDKDDK